MGLSARLVTRSSASLDAERLESAVHRASERQRLLVERGSGVDFLAIECDEEGCGTLSDVDLVLSVLHEDKRPKSEAATLAFRLIRRRPGLDILVVLVDRALVDPLSLCLFMSDVKVLYEAADGFRLPPLEVQFDEYELWKSHLVGPDEINTQQLAYWQNVLAPPPPSLELPVDSLSGLSQQAPLPPPGLKRNSLSAIALGDDLSDQLQRFALEHHIPARVLVLAAFHVLLQRYTQKEDIVIGCHSSGREFHVEIKNLVGTFENWLPLRVKCEDQPSLRNFVDRIGELLTDAEARPDVKLDALKSRVNSSEPLFQAAFEVYGNTVDEFSFPLITTRLLRQVLGLDALSASGNFANTFLDTMKLPSGPLYAGCGLQPEPSNAETQKQPGEQEGQATAIRPTKKLTFGGVDLEPLAMPSLLERCDDDLRLVGVTSPVVRLAFQFNADRFKVSTMRRMGIHFRCLLQSLLAGFQDSSMLISNLPILSPEEEHFILTGLNNTSVQFPADSLLLDQGDEELCIHELVERRAVASPSAPAVSLRNGSHVLTYKELDDRSNQLANFLQLIGVGHEQLIPVLVPRSELLVIAWLSVLKAGAAIMPMDPKFPHERVRAMVEDAGATVILTHSDTAASLDGLRHGRRVVILDKDWERTINLGSTEPPRVLRHGSQDVGPSSLAYAIYTSGSTGKPKGVLLEHRAIVNYIRWHVRYYQMTAGDRVFATAGLAFDASMADTWPTLAVGACLLPVLDPDIVIVPPRFFDWVAQERATMGFLTTQVCEMILEEDAAHPRDDIPQLRLLYTGGDRLHFGTRLEAPYRLVNIYGPTENTINSTMTLVPAGLKSPPLIGAPAPNTICLVLDPASMRPVPVGVFGELFVGGVQLARGYFQLPELTSERFIPNPFVDTVGGDRLYRTGDIVRWCDNGEIEFQGRKDTQVKIRGNRVELTAIESVLLDHDSIRDVVVIAREDTPGNKRLVAYCILNDDSDEAGHLDTKALRDFVKQRLPLFMVPAAFVQLDRFPLTPNHKVDRSALPEPGVGSVAKEAQDAETDRAVSNIKLQLASSGPNAAILSMMAKVKSIFANVLGMPESAVHDDETNFFEAGGDSLAAGRVTAQVVRLVGVDVPTSVLYKFPSVLKYCQAIRTAQSASTSLTSSDGQSDAGSVSTDGNHVCAALGMNVPSFNEESLWLLSQRTGTFASQAYNVPFSFVIDEGSTHLDRARLTQALEAITSSCEALRVCYKEPVTQQDSVDPKSEADEADRSHHVMVERVVCDKTRVDFGSREFSGDTTEGEIRAWLEDETYRPFDLATPPLLRVRLANWGKKQVFLLVVHHIIIDLWSLVLLLDNLFGTYFDGPSGDASPPDRVEYSAFIRDQREFCASRKAASMLEFWKMELKGLEPALELPQDKPRPVRKTFRGASHTFQISPAVTDAISRLCHSSGFTANIILLTAFKCLLRTYACTSSVHVGIPTAGRSREELEHVIGYFVNPVVVATDLSGDPTLTQLFHRVSNAMLGGIDHQRLPFPYLVAKTLDKAVSDNPFFNVAYVLQRPYLERPGLAEAMLGFDDIELQLHSELHGARSLAAPHRHAQFDLTLMVCIENGRISGSLQYSTDLFAASTIERMAEHLTNLVRAISACTPDKLRLSDLSLLDEAETDLVVRRFNATKREFPETTRNLCVHQLVELQARATPDRTCIAYGDHRITYRELDERSTRLANFLRFTGVGPNALVPVLINRSINLVVAWLAVLKSGGAIMPMDPKFPQERVGVMLAEGDAKIVVSEATLRDKIPPTFSGRSVLIDADWDTCISIASEVSHPAEQDPASLAYAIFTSGSTGKPKGVMLEHRSIVNYIHWHLEYYQMTAEDRVFACAGLAFDASMADTWPTLACGACLLPVVDPDVAVVPHRFLDWVVASQATMGFLTTQICEMVLEEDLRNPRGDLGKLRLIYTGGDRLHFGARQDAPYELVNIYGPTETTINAVMTKVPRGLRTPPLIGSPVPNTQCFVVALESFTPVPVGVYGELYIGGVQVGRGYFGQDGLTAERFIPNPGLGTGSERLYRTGDLVRWTAKGELEFLGRRDTQVKIRGNRIELTAIESTILEFKGIREAIVIARSDMTHSAGGADEKVLVAYVVVASPEEFDVKQVRAYVKDKLPSFMVPTAVVALAEFPLTPNHKVDRAALPRPQPSVKRSAAAAISEDQGKQRAGADGPGAQATPPTSTERDARRLRTKYSSRREAKFQSAVKHQVRELFAVAIGCDPGDVGDSEDFFEEGGHSLSAARIMSRVRQVFAVDMPLSRFLQNPTVEGVTRFVEGALRGAEHRGDATSRASTSDNRSLTTASHAPSSVGFDLRSASLASGGRIRASQPGLAANSVVASSYRDSAISEWLQDKGSMRRNPSVTSNGSVDSGAMVSGSYASSHLRRLRERPSDVWPSEDSRPGSVTSGLAQSFAHSSSWLGSNQKLQRTLEKRHIEGGKSSPVSRRPELNILSYNQQSLWFMHKMDPRRVDFVVHLCCQLFPSKPNEPVDLKALSSALQSLVDRHESLRTVYAEEGGVPYQVVYPPLGVANGSTSDLFSRSLGSSSIPPNQVNLVISKTPERDMGELSEALQHELHRPWQLETEAPFRARLYPLEKGGYVCLLTAHHIALDGWSLDILMDDFGKMYDEQVAAGGTIVKPASAVPSESKSMTVSQFAQLQKEEMHSAAGNRLWNFWQRQLAGHQTAIGLPTDGEDTSAPPSNSEGGGAWFHFEVPPQDIQQLQAIIKLERATLFMALLAFYSSLLHRYTGKEDVLIGAPMACRTIPELDRTVGNITNVVVLRMHVSKEDTFRSLLRQARAVVLSAFEHQEFPFAILVERISSFRNPQQNPLFQVLLSLNQSFSSDGDGNSPGRPSLAGLEAGETVALGTRLQARQFNAKDQVGLEQRVSPYDLQLIFSQGTKKDTSSGTVSTLHGALQYKTRLFARTTIERMAGHLLQLIKGSADYNLPYCRMPILLPEEREAIVVDWNQTGADFPQDKCIHQLVEEQAMRRPFSSAVNANGAAWTYFELNARANLLARYLRIRCRVEPGSKVGIYLERSPNMVLAMLAVAKSGGAYVPMDVAWPEDRIEYVFQDSEMAVVICDRSSARKLESTNGFGASGAPNGGPVVLPLEATWAAIERRVKSVYGSEEAAENLPPPASTSWGRDDRQWHGSRSVVYMIYTSGSTGKPKGVLIEHRSLVNVVTWHASSYSLSHNDRASQLVGSAFDPVGLEVWPFLASGASIHFVDDETRADVGQLTSWLDKNRVTVSLLPTPLLEVFLRSRHKRWPAGLRVVYGGGDKLHVPAHILDEIPFRLDNHYGPSEGTIMCSFAVVNDLAGHSDPSTVLTPTIGRPLNNYVIVILDEFLEPVPVLVPGELCIIGPGLAQGYHHRADLTRERFVEIPEGLMQSLSRLSMDTSVLGSKMYRTGDRVRYLRDGNIDFIGRVDFQVKIRGMRVELGEIESVVKQHPLVMEACVLAREDRPGQQRLCAYVVLSQQLSGADVDEVDDEDENGPPAYDEVEQTHQLQSLVKEKLPQYMMPASWVFLDQLPLTANGKVDRRALPPPSELSAQVSERAARAVVPPRSAEELVIADLWKETLGLDTISIHDNFFDLGGHSLAATQLLSQIRDTLGVELGITAFFAEPSIAGMAAAVVAKQQGNNQCDGHTAVEGAARVADGTDNRIAASGRDSPAPKLGFEVDKECELDERIVPAAAPAPGSRGENGPVQWSAPLVTGATGFLGSFLVHALFARYGTSDNHEDGDEPLRVICLVRGESDEHAVQALSDALSRFALDVDGSVPRPVLLSERDSTVGPECDALLVVRGDLALPRFGLSRQEFESLASEIDIIFHGGAFVHSLFPYSRLRAANVGGTEEVFRLACARAGSAATVVHISTLSVFAPPPANECESNVAEIDEEGPLASVGALQHLEGYAQTKWVAEFLAREACRRGVPTVIFRPGRITGHSETGLASFSDFMALFLKGCIQLQAAPELCWVMDMNPVDLVCEAILNVSLLASPNGERYEGRAFNMCHPNPMMLPEYIAWVEEYGYKCELVPYPKWRKLLVSAARQQSAPRGAARQRLSGSMGGGADRHEQLGAEEEHLTQPVSGRTASDSMSSTRASNAPAEVPMSSSVAISRGRSLGSSYTSTSGKNRVQQLAREAGRAPPGVSHGSSAGIAVGSQNSQHGSFHSPELPAGRRFSRSGSGAARVRRELQGTAQVAAGDGDQEEEEDMGEVSTSTNALYPLLPMFAPEAAQMESPVQLHFRCTQLTAAGHPTPAKLNNVYFERMIQQEFIPPPTRDNDLFAFDGE